jgi:uncharacterized protein YxeA
MKTLMKSILAVVLLITVSTLAVAQTAQPTLHVVSDNAFVLTVNKLSSDLKVKFQDKYGYRLYKENVDKDALTYQKKFSLNKLPDGPYNLELEDELQIVTLSLAVKDMKIVRDEIANAKFFKPVVYKKGEHVYVSKFSPEQEPMRVIIYNNNYDVVHDETLTGKVDLGRVYTFEEAGDYTIAVKSDNKTFEHTVSINK